MSACKCRRRVPDTEPPHPRIMISVMLKKLFCRLTRSRTAARPTFGPALSYRSWTTYHTISPNKDSSKITKSRRFSYICPKIPKLRVFLHMLIPSFFFHYVEVITPVAMGRFAGKPSKRAQMFFKRLAGFGALTRGKLTRM